MLSAREAQIQRIRVKEERNKRAAERSLAAFARQAWRQVEPSRPYSHNWHIDMICEHLEAVSRREIRNLIINIPPRHMKSLLVSVFWPAWSWGPNNKPHEEWLTAAYHPKLSTRDAVKTRRIVESEWYLKNWATNFYPQDDAPEEIDSIIRKDQNEKMNYQNVAGGVRLSTSPKGLGTGGGGDILCVDDPHKVKGVESNVQREAVIEWWDEEMSSRGNDSTTVCKVITMQRVHDKDLSGHCLDKGGYHHLCIPFEYETSRKKLFTTTNLNIKDPRESEGEIIWQGRYDKQGVADLKRSMGAYAVSGQLQQRPTPKEGVKFKRRMFNRRWTKLPAKFDKLVFPWDLTFDDTGEAWNVGYALGMKGPDIWVIDEVREKLDSVGQLRELPKLRAKWAKRYPNTKTIYIEDAANARAVVKILRLKIAGIELVRTKGMSKEDRAEAVLWYFDGGNVVFPADGVTTWVDDALDEIISFGPKAAYKDRVDALVHGVEKLTSKINRGTVSIESIEKLSQWAAAT